MRDHCTPDFSLNWKVMGHMGSRKSYDPIGLLPASTAPPWMAVPFCWGAVWFLPPSGGDAAGQDPLDAAPVEPAEHPVHQKWEEPGSYHQWCYHDIVRFFFCSWKGSTEYISRVTFLFIVFLNLVFFYSLQTTECICFGNILGSSLRKKPRTSTEKTCKLQTEKLEWNPELTRLEATELTAMLRVLH